MQKVIQLEVCAYSVESCITAEKAGANRIELCSGLYEGGLTPSIGLIMESKKSVNIDIYAMVRPRGGDFYYNETELKVIYSDIEAIKKTKVQGIVIGFLKKNGEVDVPKLKEIVDFSYPLKVVFHRAIDLTPDPYDALAAIIESRCVRILTSGQQNIAIDGIDTIDKLVKIANNKIEIMAGSGINVQNAGKLISKNIDALHLSASSYRNSEMTFNDTKVPMGNFNLKFENQIQFADFHKIQSIVSLINNIM